MPRPPVRSVRCPVPAISTSVVAAVPSISNWIAAAALVTPPIITDFIPLVAITPRFDTLPTPKRNRSSAPAPSVLLARVVCKNLSRV